METVCAFSMRLEFFPGNSPEERNQEALGKEDL